MSHSSHMRRAGIPLSRRQRVQRDARAAESFVASSLGGFLMLDPFDARGDVLLSDGEIVDVKSVPPGYRFVNGGEHRPRAGRCLVVVRTEDSFTIVGQVSPPSVWRHGPPPVENAVDCWWVRASEVRPLTLDDVDPGRTDEEPPSEQGLVFGRDVAPETSRQERLRKRWREAQARMTARKRSLPVALPWTDPETAHRGLGNGGGGRPVRRGDERDD